MNDGDREFLEERAAIHEFDGSVSREEAERLALDDLRCKRPAESQASGAGSDTAKEDDPATDSMPPAAQEPGPSEAEA